MLSAPAASAVSADVQPIGVVDVGLGNIASVHNMFRRIGVVSRGVAAPHELRGIAGLVLPGVGAFDTGMARLANADLIEPIRDLAAGPTPLLGICLGMQLLCSESEEGTAAGLGIFDASVMSLRHDRPAARLPHVGWEYVRVSAPSPLLPGGETDHPPRFYFVHSFGVAATAADVMATADFDGVPVAAALGNNTRFGVQFHPEKSHRYGMDLLRRFWETACCPTD